jgi:hypothetical protein
MKQRSPYKAKSTDAGMAQSEVDLNERLQLARKNSKSMAALSPRPSRRMDTRSHGELRRGGSEEPQGIPGMSTADTILANRKSALFVRGSADKQYHWQVRILSASLRPRIRLRHPPLLLFGFETSPHHRLDRLTQILFPSCLSSRRNHPSRFAVQHPASRSRDWASLPPLLLWSTPSPGHQHRRPSLLGWV